MNNQLIKLSLPLILSQGIQTVMVLTDRYILSLKNPFYTSAATTGGFTAVSFSLFFVHLLFFSTALIANKHGKNDLRSSHMIVRQCLFIASISLPILLILSQVGDFYFSFLGHPEDYRLIENSYFQIMMLSQALVLYRTVIESYFLGVNRSQGILAANLIGMFANIPLSYWFVLGPCSGCFQGAAGAAWGTVCANFLSLLYLGYLYYQTSDARNHKISWQEAFGQAEWRPLLQQGSYAGLEKFTNSFCFVCFVNMFVYYGKEVSTAVSIVFSWDQIAFLPLMGMYGAVMSLYSRFLGQGDPKGAIRSLHAAAKLTFGLMLGFSILFWTSADKLIIAFLGDRSLGMDYPIVHQHSKFFFQTTCLYIFANAAIFIYKAALRSLGFSGWCFGVSFSAHILLVVASYCGVYVFGVGSKTIWLFFMSMLAILSVSFIAKFYWTIRSREVAQPN